MARTRWLRQLREVGWGLLVVLACFTLTPSAAQFPTNLQTSGTVVSHPGKHKGVSVIGDDSSENSPPLTTRQMQYMLRVNLERSKNDAAELAALAKELREELNKSNTEGLSLEALARIDRIEKLAKKIRDEVKGF